MATSKNQSISILIMQPCMVGSLGLKSTEINTIPLLFLGNKIPKCLIKIRYNFTYGRIINDLKQCIGHLR